MPRPKSDREVPYRTDTHVHQMTRYYLVGDLPFVPHYTKRGIFVAPGGAMQTEHQLEQRNAAVMHQAMWPRCYPKVQAATPSVADRSPMDPQAHVTADEHQALTSVGT